MIKRMTHTSLFVLDQDNAYEFFVNKLGFKVVTDDKSEGFRWLTVSPPNQNDLEIILMPVTAGFMFNQEAAEKTRDVIKNGNLGGFLFEVDDCRKTYEELLEKGVNFKIPPEEKFYGIEAVMTDDSGNWFSIIEPKD